MKLGPHVYRDLTRSPPVSRYSVPLVSVRVVAMTDARLASAYGAVEDGGVRGEEARASPLLNSGITYDP